jgi:hypothetical protein
MGLCLLGDPLMALDVGTTELLHDAEPERRLQPTSSGLINHGLSCSSLSITTIKRVFSCDVLPSMEAMPILDFSRLCVHCHFASCSRIVL